MPPKKKPTGAASLLVKNFDEADFTGKFY